MGDIKLDLNQFTGGTGTWWRHPLHPKYTYTDGMKYVAEQCGAYWFIDKIFATQSEQAMKKQAFQVWKIQVLQDSQAVITVEDGNDNILATYPLDYTDFPTQGVSVWFTDNVLMLPAEY